MLEISNLHCSIGGNEILRGLSLSVNAGEVHAIMGPNGSGKSTLAQVVAGTPGLRSHEGSVTYEGKDLLELEPEERAREGIFLGFQYPVEIPGVNNAYLLKAATQREAQASGPRRSRRLRVPQARARENGSPRHGPEVPQSRRQRGFLGRREESATRSCRWRCSSRKLAILDETDSGLDIDALKAVAEGVNALAQS